MKLILKSFKWDIVLCVFFLLLVYLMDYGMALFIHQILNIIDDYEKDDHLFVFALLLVCMLAMKGVRIILHEKTMFLIVCLTGPRWPQEQVCDLAARH